VCDSEQERITIGLFRAPSIKLIQDTPSLQNFLCSFINIWSSWEFAIESEAISIQPEVFDNLRGSEFILEMFPPKTLPVIAFNMALLDLSKYLLEVFSQ
jgi:hypothetical protein